MTTAIVKADPFTATLATLKADWPATFALEVDEHVFRNVGSMEKAQEISGAMERMKRDAVEMGYKVDVSHELASRRWLYFFMLLPGFTRPKADPKPVAALPPGPDDLDKLLDEEKA